MPLPSGTVTFLFSDIEGSTRRWERDSQAMAAALARHDALVQSAIAENSGYAFKAMGDAFCAAFPSAHAAVSAALDAQRALLAEDFSQVGGILVRMALHTGSAQERNADYFGPPVNRVARLLSIGHGGQVLVSAATAQLLENDEHPEFTLRDLGPHRLKDLARPERVHQLVADGLVETFPALRSLERLPNNLPPQLTSFVGREEDVAQVKALVQRAPLVTLVGPGGVGKTRCAIQAGAELLDDFGDGAWLVELASISDPSLVTNAVARALGVREAPNRPLLETIEEHLADYSALLILDNCEHVIEEARSVIASILRGCAGVKVLATSRESLNIAGERIFKVPSLALPPPGERITAVTASSYGAVALFADRAAAADARFALSDENAPFVAEIAARLDGIPLAIELAAARMKVLSAHNLAQRLNERFRVLTGGDRSALPRQQTLRATIDWSFDLLDERERALLRRLSVFSGGWTLEAAAAVCGDDGRSDELDMLDSISALVDKSLVAVDSLDGDPRYRMLFSIREYGLERLSEAGETDRTAGRHAGFFAGFVRGLEALVADLEDAQWRFRLAPELDNLRTAIEWTISKKHDPALGLCLLADLEWPEFITTPQEALGWFDAALALVDASNTPLVAARILRHWAHVAWLAGRSRTQREEIQRRALEAARAAGDPNEAALALTQIGDWHRSGARFDEAHAAFAQAYENPELLSRFTTNALLRSWAINDLQRGDAESARRRLSESARLERPGSEAHASALLNLGELEFAAGNFAAAREAAREAKEVLSDLHSVHLAVVLSNLAAYAMAADDVEDARGHLREAIDLDLLSGQRLLKTVIEHHALLAALLDDCERAALLIGFSDAIYRSSGEVRQYTEGRSYERLMALLAQAYVAEELARTMELGARWTQEQALAAAAAIHERYG